MKNYKLKNFNAKNFNFKKINFLSNLEDKNKKSNNFKLLHKINGMKTTSNIKHLKNNLRFSNTHTINFSTKIKIILNPLKFILKIARNNKKFSSK